MMPININRPVYSMASVNDQSAEITMYGDIYESQPRDWWGDPIEGQFILLSEFLEDLDKIKGCTSVTIRMNSYGGDAGASNTIHNRLREMARDGVATECIVDGAAMSGGSLIMCACDKVKVNPSSMIMIHKCWSFMCGGYNADELRERANTNDAWDKMQVECYKRKTKLSATVLLHMMAETTYMTGREALEKGFADELIEDAEPVSIASSATGHHLFVNGYKMNLPHNLTLPKQLPINTDEAKEITDISNERTRLLEIDEIASVLPHEDVQEARYGSSPCSAQGLAYRVAKAAAKRTAPAPSKASMTNEEKYEAGRQMARQLLHPENDVSSPVHINASSSTTLQTNDKKMQAGRTVARSLLSK